VTLIALLARAGAREHSCHKPPALGSAGKAACCTVHVFFSKEAPAAAWAPGTGARLPPLPGPAGPSVRPYILSVRGCYREEPLGHSLTLWRGARPLIVESSSRATVVQTLPARPPALPPSLPAPAALADHAQIRGCQTTTHLVPGSRSLHPPARRGAVHLQVGRAGHRSGGAVPHQGCPARRTGRRPAPTAASALTRCPSGAPRPP
jgi:hypothetical protein